MTNILRTISTRVASILGAWNLVLVLTTGCDPDIPPLGAANLDGRWNFSFENIENGCEFSEWTIGERITVPFLLFQKERDLTARADGFAGLALSIGLGTPNFSGTVVGRTLRLQALSTTEFPGSGACAYLLRVTVEGQANGDFIDEGVVIWEPAQDNGHPDCERSRGCESIQTFRGVREGPHQSTDAAAAPP
jgi:hypothetical protein